MSIAIESFTSPFRLPSKMQLSKLLAGATFVIVALAGLFIWFGTSNLGTHGQKNAIEKAAQVAASTQEDRVLKVEDLPADAQAALKKYFDDVFVKTPAGHHLSQLDRLSQLDQSWEFDGTGNEVWPNLRVWGSDLGDVNGGDKVRFANLSYQVLKKPLTIADKLNKRTEKFLIVVQADAVQECKDEDGSGGTAWYDSSKGLDFPKAFLQHYESGNWTVTSPIKKSFVKPDDSFDISKL